MRCFLNRLRHNRDELLGPVLQNVPRCSALHRFEPACLFDRTGDENERNVGRNTPRELEGGKPIEGREIEIGENHCGLERAQGFNERAFGVDPDRDDREPSPLQLALGKLRIHCTVFEH